MKPCLNAILAALAGALLLGGCAVAPAYGPYDYGYAPNYYDGGPAYYDYRSDYTYAPPAVVGTFRFDQRDRNRDTRWRDGQGSWHHEGSWQHNSLNAGSGRAITRTLRPHRTTTARPASRDRTTSRNRRNDSRQQPRSDQHG